MASKKSHTLRRVLLDSAVLFLSLFKTIPNIIFLIKNEAHLAGKTLTSWLLLYLIAGMLLTTTWLCVLAILFIYFVSSMHMSLSFSLFIIILLNTILLMATYLMMLRVKNHFFTQSRRQIE